jgi:DNA-binding XRE family transcriptional regulator
MSTATRQRHISRQRSPLNGERLRQLRRQRFLERKELARLAGIGYHTLADMENWNYMPKVSTVRAVAKALRVPPGSFLSRDWHKR